MRRCYKLFPLLQIEFYWVSKWSVISSGLLHPSVWWTCATSANERPVFQLLTNHSPGLGGPISWVMTRKMNGWQKWGNQRLAMLLFTIVSSSHCSLLRLPLLNGVNTQGPDLSKVLMTLLMSKLGSGQFSLLMGFNFNVQSQQCHIKAPSEIKFHLLSRKVVFYNLPHCLFFDGDH